MYADERELLVFRTFSQSVSVPKKVFDTLTPQAKRPAALQTVKKLPNRPCFCYNRRNGGVFMEDRRRDARREPIIVALDAPVPKDHLLRKIEKVMNYEWLYERLAS